MALHFKKDQQLWIWIAYDRDRGCIRAFEVGGRSRDVAQKLYSQIKDIDVTYFCTDNYPAYLGVFPEGTHIVGKSETCAVEASNSLIRHFLARFHRRTFCYSKSISMVVATLNIFITPNWNDFIY